MFPTYFETPSGRYALLAALCLAVLCALSLASSLAHAQSDGAQDADARPLRDTLKREAIAPRKQRRARPPRVRPQREASARPVPAKPAPKQATALPEAIPPADPFRWTNEEFYFSIRFNGIEAMRAILRSGDLQHAKNRDYIPLSAFAQSVGFFHNIYPLVDRANTFIDPIDARPIRSEKHFEERGQTRIYKVDFWANLFRAEVFKSRGDKGERYNHAIPVQTHDMLSWFYSLRARPAFKVGDTFHYYVYDGWKFSRVDMEVVGKEDVYTPMGWFKGWKLKFSRNVMNAKRQRDKKRQPASPKLTMKTPNDHSGHLWVSRDANRLPIKVAIDSQFGTGVAVLIKYKPHN